MILFDLFPHGRGDILFLVMTLLSSTGLNITTGYVKNMNQQIKSKQQLSRTRKCHNHRPHSIYMVYRGRDIQ